MKNFNNKLFILVIALFSFILLNSYISYKFYSKLMKNNNIIRLHVVANSNSLDDQIVKLKVNEKINEYLKNLDMSNLSNYEILDIIKEKSDDILSITNSTLIENNKNYKSKLEVGKIFYNDRS